LAPLTSIRIAATAASTGTRWPLPPPSPARKLRPPRRGSGCSPPAPSADPRSVRNPPRRYPSRRPIDERHVRCEMYCKRMATSGIGSCQKAANLPVRTLAAVRKLLPYILGQSFTPRHRPFPRGLTDKAAKRTPVVIESRRRL
jgi:hypothetical protein